MADCDFIFSFFLYALPSIDVFFVVLHKFAIGNKGAVG